MIFPCKCCKTLFRTPAAPGASVAYCDRCEVAYLEFKLGLLIVAYRQVAKKADEV